MAQPSVLIVDDHAAFRAAARELLTGCGFDIVGEAADGRTAITAAAVLRPDVVVLDVRLPDLDGFEVTRRLLAEPDAPAIVLVSTRDARDLGGRVRESGALGFITKHCLSGGTLLALLRGQVEGGDRS